MANILSNFEGWGPTEVGYIKKVYCSEIVYLSNCWEISFRMYLLGNSLYTVLRTTIIFISDGFS